MPSFLIITIGLMLLLFLMMIWAVSRYIKCPPDKLLVVYGHVEDGNKDGLKVLHGGATFVWPVIQDHEFIDLAPYTYNFNPDLLTKDLVPIQVAGELKYGVSSHPTLINVAASRLLGIGQADTQRLGENIINSELTKIFEEQDVVEISTFKKKEIVEKIVYQINPALNEIGLELINIKVDSINDKEGIIKQLEQAYQTKKTLNFDTSLPKTLLVELADIDEKIEQNTLERKLLLKQKLELLVKKR